jgi:HlyD family secretion protein
MTRTRLFIGIIVVLALALSGYAAYASFLAPEAAAPTPRPDSGLDGLDSPQVVTAEGKVIPARDATLAFRMGGQVSELLAQAGDVVEEGDALIRLQDADLQAAVLQAKAAVALAQANLDQVKAGPRPEEIASLEAQLKAAQAGISEAVARRDEAASGPTPDSIAAAQAQLAQAQAQQKEAQIAYDRIQENIKFLAGPTEEQGRFRLNAANQAVAAAQSTLDELNKGASANVVKAYNSAVSASVYQRDVVQAQLDLLKAGARQEQIDAAQAQLDQAQAGLEAAEAALDQAELRAPFDGTVMRVEIEAGETASPGVPVVVLADISRWRLQTSDLAETDVVLVQTGQPVIVTLDAFTDQTFTGTVSEIAAVSEVTRGNVTYAVVIELDPTDAPLRWGMTAFADIDVEP